jgi:hypothetical protein
MQEQLRYASQGKWHLVNDNHKASPLFLNEAAKTAPNSIRRATHPNLACLTEATLIAAIHVATNKASVVLFHLPKAQRSVDVCVAVYLESRNGMSPYTPKPIREEVLQVAMVPLSLLAQLARLEERARERARRRDALFVSRGLR